MDNIVTETPAASPRRPSRRPFWVAWLAVGLVLACLACSGLAGGMGLMGWVAWSDSNPFAARPPQRPTRTPDVAATATAGASATSGAQAEATATAQAGFYLPPAGWSAYMVDEFNSNSGDWGIGSPDSTFGSANPGIGVNIQIADGLFTWELSSDQAYTQWNVPGVAGKYDQFYVSVEARKAAGSNSRTFYGLVYHLTDSENFEIFVINDAGQYFVSRLRDGKWSVIVPPASVDSILPNHVNRLTAAAHSGRLWLLVNDQVVTSLDYDVSKLKTGRVGLAVHIQTAAENVVVEFDHFVIYLPAPIG